MKVLLISVPIMDYVADDNTGEEKLIPIAMDAIKNFPPYGIYLLASILQKHGHIVEILDFIAAGHVSIELLQKKITSVDLVGISTTSLNWPTVVMCIKQIHKIDGNIPIVIGGIHASMFDVYILRNFPIPYVIRGEGEIALASLCNALEKKCSLNNIPGLTYKEQNGQIIRNPIALSLTGNQISDLPLPAYDLLPNKAYNSLSIESSRGCPHDCAFCSTSYRKSWRPVPASNFVDKIEAMSGFFDKVNSQTIQIVDDEWSVNQKRCIEICDIFQRRNVKHKIIFDARATDLQNERLVEAITPHVKRFLIGAECGYDDGLKKIGKGTSCNVLETAAKLLAKYHIAEKCDFSFVIGFPWESKNEILKTIEFASNLFLEFGVRILLQWYCMIPGSRLWDQAYHREQVTASHYDEFGFFRNLYLFRTGVQLLPSEILDISTRVKAVMGLAELSYSGKEMIQFRTPSPIYRYFSETSLNPQTKDLKQQALTNLRELSTSARKSMQDKNLCL